MERRRDPAFGVLLGLTAALTFGASAPIAKRLLDDIGPQLLAGLLYAGAALALGVGWLVRPRTSEAPLRRQDLPRLAGLTASGAVVAPVLLLVGLERVRGVTGSLLLNLEGPATLLLAVALFGEHLSRRAAAGAVALFGAAALLGSGGEADGASALGVLCIVGACVAWAIDNNLTQSLTTRDPVALVAVKAAAGGAVNLVIGAARGGSWPGGWPVVAALVLGAVSYGASVLLDAYALRLLGAAREAAVFATAPFAGAVLAVPLLDEHVGATDVAAGALMAAGVALTLWERHEHVHVHEPVTHDHVHFHDPHHRHDHPPGTPPEPHAHEHEHERLEHAHPHVSDVHHRHRHRGG